MSGGRPLRADARRNRDAIVAAARSAFDRDEQMRFDDFAALAGVGVGTLYRHFPTRDALVAAVYQDELASLTDRARVRTQSPAADLEAFLRGFVSHVVARAGLARTLGALVSPSVQAEGGSDLEQAVGDLIDRAVAVGAIRGDVAPGAVMVVLHGIGSASERPAWPEEAQAVIELLIAGLRSR